jgi:hypothetical protein
MDQITASYAAAEAEARLAREILLGSWAGMFWTTVAAFAGGTAIPFLHFVRRNTRVGPLVVAAALVSVASILERVLITVPSQTVGMLLPYPAGSYVPTLGEWSVVLGLCAVGALVFLVFAKVFPLLPVAEEGAAALAARPETPGLRAAIFWTTLALGLSLAVAGFLLSLRFGTLPYLDPVVPYSPMLFAAGVMLVFYSAAAYETLPPTRGS